VLAMGTSEITWLFLLLPVAAGNLLSAKALFDICGTEDLSLEPSNSCFYRLFSLAQIWDECQILEESCVESCLFDDFCTKLHSDGKVSDGYQKCEKLVTCIHQEDTQRPGAVQRCYEGHPLPRKDSDGDSALQDWLSLAGVGPTEVTLPFAPAPAPAFASAEVNPPAPAPATAPVVSEKTVVEEAVQQVPPIASAPAIAPLSAVPKSTKEAVPEHASDSPPKISKQISDASCRCSISGSVKGTDTGRQGCAAHKKEQVSQDSKYCFMEGGAECKDADGAQASKEFPGLFWKECSAIDNLLAIFPPSCQVFKAQSQGLVATQQLVAKLEELQNSNRGNASRSSPALEDLKQFLKAADVSTMPRKSRLRRRELRPSP